MKLYVRLLFYVKPYTMYLIGAVFCILLLSATSSLIAYLVKPAIDEVFVKNASVLSAADLRNPAALGHMLDGEARGFEARLLYDAVPAAERRQLQESVVALPDSAANSARDIFSQLLNKLMRKKKLLRQADAAPPVVSRKQAVEAAAVAAFNALIADERFYIKHQQEIVLQEAQLAYHIRDELSRKGLLARDAGGRWSLKNELARKELEDVRWFTIALLARLYPDVFAKNQQRDYRMLMLIPLLLIGCYLLKGLADYGQAYLIGAAGNRAVTDARGDVYRHIQGLSLAFYSRMSTGELMSRIANDVGMLRRALSNSVMKLVRNFFMVIGLTGVAIYQNWQMAFVCLVALPTVSFPIVKLGRKGRKYSRKTQEQMGELSTFLDETISGNQTVKSYCMESYETKRFAGETERLYRLALKSIKVGALSSPVMGVFGAFMVAGIIYYGGYQVITGVMTPGQFFSFMAALAMLLRPVKALSRENIKIQRGMAAAVRVFAILDVTSDIVEKEDAIELPALCREVELRNVSFRYDDAPVLKNISLTARAGEVIALVGHSGAGKSTIANLLLRFYDPQEGGVFIDGVDIRDVTITSLRDQIAFVSQETILFNDTVKNNIAYGSTNVTDDKIFAATQAAFAHDFIQELPGGYDTMIGEKGIRLSGGQRQRIAIARAIMKDAPILVLDEATSALDTHSERAVHSALENLMRGRTTFVIAHRLSTIRDADQILVLSDGEVIERGTHADLIRHSGVYNRLIEIQSGYQKKQTGYDHII